MYTDTHTLMYASMHARTHAHTHTHTCTHTQHKQRAYWFIRRWLCAVVAHSEVPNTKGTGTSNLADGVLQQRSTYTKVRSPNSTVPNT